LFDRPANGGELCTARLIAGLQAQGHEVRVLGRGTAAAPRLGLRQHTLGPALAPFDQLHALARMGSLGRSVLSGQASTVQRLNAGDAPRKALDWLLAEPAAWADALVVDHLQTWAWVEAAGQALPPALLVMHNLESMGYLQRSQHAASAGQWLRAQVFRREARLLRDLETRALRQAAAVACLSDADAKHLSAQAAELGVSPLVEVLPGYPLRLGSPGAIDIRRVQPGARWRVGMLGTWTWGPNREALQWMLGQVMPKLSAGCTLVLAGSGLDGMALPPGVICLGRIDDVDSFYAQVDVVALPALSGTGVQEKAIEAMGSARGIVATTHALRGLGPELPPQVRVADCATSFANACAPATRASGAEWQRDIACWSGQRQLRYTVALSRCLRALGTPRPTAISPEMAA